jgi:hypothetical protein
MSTFILSNSIHILKRIYQSVSDLTLDVLIRPEEEHVSSIKRWVNLILDPDIFRDITDIDDYYTYLDTILKSIKTQQFQSEVHKIFFVLKKISNNKTFKFKSIFLFINYLLQPEMRDEEGGSELAPAGGASSSSDTPVSRIRINLLQEDRIRIRNELILILNTIKNEPGENAASVLTPLMARIEADIKTMDDIKNRDLALGYTAEDKVEMINVEAQFARKYLDDYLNPRFNTSRSMDEFVEYLDIRSVRQFAGICVLVSH